MWKKEVLKSISKWLSIFFTCLVISLIIGTQVFIYFSKDLPSYDQLAQYSPPVITRIYDKNVDVIAEYAIEKRIYTDYRDVPELLIKAFLAAEDKNFFQHKGIDIMSIIRAMLQNIINLQSDKRVVGASTITQQVVKDFLLTNERTISRKIKEAILAYRISHAYSKETILELYLNQIFLGHNSYGISAAAHNYFNKDLKDLEVSEMAMLAALPKAPSQLNPFANYDKAKARRDWVISRMEEEGFITSEESARAKNSPIDLYKKSQSNLIGEDFYANTVKQEVIKLLDNDKALGEEKLYKNGLVINTYLDKDFQKMADIAFKNGIIKYDRAHGWRGPVAKIDAEAHDLSEQLKKITIFKGNYQLAVVTKTTPKFASIFIEEGLEGVIPLSSLNWARRCLPEQRVGPAVKSVQDVLTKGDVILVSLQTSGSYNLEQVPLVNGGMVVLDVRTARVLAMVGGYNFAESNFNRAIQAIRQPGSALKPFIGLAALEKGFKPTSILLDTPLSLNQGSGAPVWTPKNYTETFLGPITLRTAIEKSRNIPIIRLVLALGLKEVAEMTQRLNIYHNPPNNYSMALGAFETTLLNLTNAYNTIANNGRYSIPKFIDSIYDQKGNLLFSSDQVFCDNCNSPFSLLAAEEQNSSYIPSITHISHEMIAKDINYQMISILEGAVERGTATRAKVIANTIAGKTGSTNNSFDTWFIGFSPDITVGVYVGFDQPRTLGKKEVGATLALPIFVDFMKEAMKNIPKRPFEIPANIRLQAIDVNTGKSSSGIPDGRSIINEAVREDGKDIEGLGEMSNQDSDNQIDQNWEQSISSLSDNDDGE